MADSGRWSAEDLETFVHRVFEAHSTPTDIAAEAARHMVRSNLSGHDSHGVIRVNQYVREIESGEMAADARPSVLRQTDATGLIDARRGFGLYTTAWALDWAMERTGRQGATVVAIRHSTHTGRMGEYAERAAERGLVALVTVGAAGPGVGLMMPTGGQQVFLGANPYAVGVPADGRPPMLFDGSTSTIAGGKIRVARDKGGQLPPDCILDRDGNPTTDPEDYFAGGTIVPLGGSVAGHKGSGLSLASALLGALGMIGDPDPTLITANVDEKVADARGRVGGVLMLVVDPAAFGGREEYRAMVGESLSAVKRVRPREGVAEVLVPGEVEVNNRRQRSRDGIPLPEATVRGLAKIGKRFGVALPDPLD